MSNISSLIDVLKMEDTEKKTRAAVIITLGIAINHEFGSNATEPLVYELVRILDPQNAILENEHYKRMANVR